MRRPLLSILCVLACVCVPAAVGARADTSQPVSDAMLHWADPQIGTVLAAGVMGPSAEAFDPQGQLTRGDLAAALEAWGHPMAPPADLTVLVTVRELDARLVAALGMQAAARTIRIAARDAGLAPVSSLGTETVARLLGLRTNHPTALDALELLPGQPATRAEAAYSLAQAMSVVDWQKQRVLDGAATFSFPELTDWQRTVLSRALRFVGDPYVWTGTSEKQQQTLWDGTVVPGGFDCSGFVWRVYKLQPYPGAPTLTDSLRGRTTYAMSGEVTPDLRIAQAGLQPADVVFFGSRGLLSSPNQIGHVGIYLGNGWFVHSSSRGVTLEPLIGWYQNSFAWGRRPLAEAGLEG
ncbi:MAG: NlpC/P60 family protein [Gaiellaceae bacterium]